MLGGFLIEHFRWSSVFFINLPIMVLVLAVGVPMLRESSANNSCTCTCASCASCGTACSSAWPRKAAVDRKSVV